MKRTTIREGPWTKRRLDMMRSPAWRALSANAKCVIERLEIEHMLHAGKDNGRLVCTHRDLAEHGIRYPSIAAAIRNAVELGFVEITQRGYRSAGHGRPAHYRLTYLPSDAADPTNEWANIEPPHAAEMDFFQIRKPIRSRIQKRIREPDTKTYLQGRQSPGYENVSTI
jgi:hypothetical protein